MERKRRKHQENFVSRRGNKFSIAPLHSQPDPLLPGEDWKKWAEAMIEKFNRQQLPLMKASHLDMQRRDFSAGCLRSGCHKEISNQAWVHDPAAVGACGRCHTPDSESNKPHTFIPARSRERLCSYCHKHPKTKKYEHKPFQDSECLFCHDPHGSRYNHLLLSATPENLCLKCHSIDKLSNKGQSVFKGVHRPAAEGKCLTCHSAHLSDHKGLLKAGEPELCRECHKDFFLELASGKTVHKALDKNCSACHLPHAGKEKLVRSTGKAVCLGCHEKVKDSLINNPDIHAAIQETPSCLSCHLPHSSDTRKLTKEKNSRICLDCHNRSYKIGENLKIRNIQSEINSSPFVHEPLKKGDCVACHDAHLPKNQHMLSYAYPMTQYAKVSPNTYRLCFQCHDQQLANEKESLATGFRNGKRNLHYVHLKLKKSRTCYTCHTSHASRLPKLVRKTIPFGNKGWQLKLAFQKTRTGGTCRSDCHKTQTYVNKKLEKIETPYSTRSSER